MKLIINKIERTHDGGKFNPPATNERKCAMNRLDREQVSTDIYDFLSREASPDVQVNNDTKCAL